jgi:8-oxo-dGTP pyrophosphatase MutT (NUDIX family)
MQKKTVIKNEKHFTASVWIVTEDTPCKVLLIHHKKLNRWLQLGGHIEKFENPVEAAVREAREESGVDISFLIKEVKAADSETKFLPVPQFIVEQYIPSYKDEPEHFHLDMQYVVRVPEQKLKRSVNEARGIGWFSKKEALDLPIHEDTRKILQNLI